MKKTILITGSTDGIGLEAAKALAAKGHKVLLHGRSKEKLQKAKEIILESTNGAELESYITDLSNIEDVKTLAKDITSKHNTLDVLINNAGVFKTSNPTTKDGLDVRFVVNTIVPYFLTKLLIPILTNTSRVINLSSAAQAPVSMDALLGRENLSDGEAYAQSKLALTMFTFHMAKDLKNTISSIIAVNPASLLASKMVKEAYGISGNDITIGSNILVSMALDDKFVNMYGKYFDNDIGRFSSPHPDALDSDKCEKIVQTIENFLKNWFF